MNSDDIIEFDGKEITIKDLWKKSNKEIAIGLYVEVQNLKDLPDKVIKNGKDIANMKGRMTIMIPVILAIVGYLITQHII